MKSLGKKLARGISVYTVEWNVLAGKGWEEEGKCKSDIQELRSQRNYFFYCLFLGWRDRKRKEAERERERERIPSRLHAQGRARCGSQSHEPGDHDLS